MFTNHRRSSYSTCYDTPPQRLLSLVELAKAELVHVVHYAVLLRLEVVHVPFPVHVPATSHTPPERSTISGDVYSPAQAQRCAATSVGIPDSRLFKQLVKVDAPRDVRHVTPCGPGSAAAAA